MACLYGGDEQRDPLLGKLLTVRHPLGNREATGELGFLVLLFAVDLRPLVLIARG